MIRFHYRLDSPEGQGSTQYVDADNKTQARKVIGESYRADTPRAAARSGFIPFSKCRIVWLDEEGEAPITQADRDELHEWVQPSENPLAISDPRIGMLMREGQTVYYAFLRGDYDNGYFEGDLQAVTSALNSPVSD